MCYFGFPHVEIVINVNRVNWPFRLPPTSLRFRRSHLELVGIEALLVLRTEKGYLHLGADTDGTTNPRDLGFGAIVNKKGADFVGKRSLFRSGDQRENRRQFVGVEPIDNTSAFASGAHFIDESNDIRRSQGFITSACYSPILDRHIGLGLLEGGFKRKGEQQHHRQGKHHHGGQAFPGA